MSAPAGFGIRFGKGWRMLVPHEVRARIPAGLRLWTKNLIASDLDRSRRGRASRLEDRLWGGFSGRALAGLAEIRAEGSPGAAAQAAWILARWRAVAGDDAGALDEIVAMRETDPPVATQTRQYRLEALFLIRLGRGAEAERLLRARLEGRDPDSSDRLLLSAACNPGSGGTDPAAALAHLDGVFAASGLAGVRPSSPDGALKLDALTGAGPVAPVFDPEGRVTVIVPAHRAEDTISTALRSLAAQSWTNLEILVVDDASPDGTAAEVEAFAERDPRIRLVRRETNGGSYAARNSGLAEATGVYVTNHDSDDWSHPEKIRLHVEDLRTRDAPFNLSAWVRTSDDMVFQGPWRPTRKLVTRNLSSVFFRRDVAERVGPWDTARVSADREFINRMQKVFGLPRQKPLLPDVPLSFGRAGEGSMTALKATHVSSQYHGIRREYHEACDEWHARLDLDAVRTSGLDGAPPFVAAPVPIRSTRSPEPRLDLLFIGDFNFHGGAFHSAMNMIAAGRAAGKRCGLLQYRRHDEDVTRPLKTDVRRFARDHDVRIVAAGEALEARVAIVTYPPIFEEKLDRFPQVEPEHVVVVVNQMAERDAAKTDVAYDPARVRAHLRELLGSEGSWAPISERVRALMEADPRYPAPAPDTWTPLIDTSVWCACDPVWRGGTRARPVIGRHGRDNRLKWPSDPEALRAAYCAGRPCELRFLGGARHARRALRRWPRNWRELPFGSEDVRDFLGDLDFFLHYPDPSYIEEFGRAPMEAMAVGVPVILPPEFEPTFGEAALYATPNGVWPCVEALWRDEAAWMERVAAGRRFVATRCGQDAFAARVSRIETS